MIYFPRIARNNIIPQKTLKQNLSHYATKVVSISHRDASVGGTPVRKEPSQRLLPSTTHSLALSNPALKSENICQKRHLGRFSKVKSAPPPYSLKPTQTLVRQREIVKKPLVRTNTASEKENKQEADFQKSVMRRLQKSVPLQHHMQPKDINSCKLRSHHSIEQSVVHHYMRPRGSLDLITKRLSSPHHAPPKQKHIVSLTLPQKQQEKRFQLASKSPLSSLQTDDQIMKLIDEMTTFVSLIVSNYLCLL